MSDPKDEGTGPVGPVSAPKRRRLIVHTLAGRGAVSEAERAAAKAFLERNFGDYERFRQSLPEEPPPAKPAKTIPFWPAGAEKPSDLIAFVNELASRLGYEPIGRVAIEDKNDLGFRANWGTAEIEHFVSFGSWGRPNQFLNIQIGLRHSPADAFAYEERLKFLPDDYREIFARRPPWQCVMWVDLGRARDREPFWRLDTAEFSPAQLADRIVALFHEPAAVRLGSVRDIQALFDLVMQDRRPFPWEKWGDSMRVSVAAYLGRKLGRPASNLRPALVPHVGSFKSPPNTSEPSAAEFVDRVLADAEAALAAG